jgi:hypothetical protein
MVVVKEITEVGMFTVTTATYLTTAVKYNFKWVITLSTGVTVITRILFSFLLRMRQSKRECLSWQVFSAFFNIFT